jgi:hypothetical protein
MRAIIWTVVGILLVAAIAIFIYMRAQDSNLKQALEPTAAQIKQEADRLAKKADEYAAEVKKLRGALGAQLDAARKAKLAKLDSLVGLIKTDAGKLVGLTGDKLLTARRALNARQQDVLKLKHELEKGPGK